MLAQLFRFARKTAIVNYFVRIFRVTKPFSYSLPLIDIFLANFVKAKYFTTLDFRSSYWQVPIEESDKEKTAFATFRGCFEFNVIGFGLGNAQGFSFQEIMAKVLQGLDFA